MADVGVIERRNRTRFAGEALGELGVGDFDRDVAAKAGIMRAIHFAHSALAHESENFIRAEFVAGRERHGNDSAKCT
jgi:hypothetical protein